MDSGIWNIEFLKEQNMIDIIQVKVTKNSNKYWHNQGIAILNLNNKRNHEQKKWTKNYKHRQNKRGLTNTYKIFIIMQLHTNSYITHRAWQFKIQDKPNGALSLQRLSYAQYWNTKKVIHSCPHLMSKYN